MKKILISIICPVYNSEIFLEECILSVINQSESNWELMLIDDGSCDLSGAICDGFSRKDKRIKTIHKNNEGQMRARIDGIKRSSGDYIMFLDSDDMLENNAIKIINNYISQHSNLDCFLFNAKTFPNSENSKSLPKVDCCQIIYSNIDAIKHTFGDQMFGYLWMYCFKKAVLMSSLIDNSPYLNVRYTEDGAFVFRAISMISGIGLIDSTLYLYRDNVSSITHNLTNKDRYDRFLVFDYIYSEIFKVNKDFVLSNQNAEMVSWALFSILEHTDNEKEFKQLFKIARESTIFIRICKKTKTSNRRFKFYKLLLTLNFRHLFYKFCSR